MRLSKLVGLGLALSAVLLTGCAGKTYDRAACSHEIDTAWKELSFAEAAGLAGTVSYSKALALLTAAKTQQQFEKFASCKQKAKRARFYIAESRAGR